MRDRGNAALSTGLGGAASADQAPNMDALLLPSWRTPTPAAVARERELRRLTWLLLVGNVMIFGSSSASVFTGGHETRTFEIVRGLALLVACAVTVYVAVRQWKLWRAAKREAAARGEAGR